MLSLRCLHQSLNLLSFKPDLDLFATQINRQFSDYVAYRPDPEAQFMDAFTIDWPDLKFYALPPIAIISKVLSKMSQDEAKGIIVVLAKSGLVSCHAENADINSHIVKRSEIASATTTVARSESPNVAKDGHDWRTYQVPPAQHCQKQPLRSYQLPGDRGQSNVTMGTLNGLLTFVINGRQIPFVQPLKQA